MNEDSRDELYSMLHEIMLSDYEYTRNYRNFLEVSRSYFTASATNNRNMHAILDRIMSLESSTRINNSTNGNRNRYSPVSNNINNFQDTINPNYNQNIDEGSDGVLNNTTNLTRNIPNMNSFWNGLWNRPNNQNTTVQNRSRTRTAIETGNGTRVRPMNTPNFITLLSNTLLQNEFLNSRLEQERLPTEEEINNSCQVLLYRDCSNNNQTRCPIDMIDFEPEDSIMRITHCGHIFREANLRRNFQTSPSCPMCRYSIVQDNTTRVGNNRTRENSNSQVNQTTENSNNIITRIMNQIHNNPNTLTGNENFVDASGNNVSVEYSVSSHFI